MNSRVSCSLLGSCFAAVSMLFLLHAQLLPGSSEAAMQNG